MLPPPSRRDGKAYAMEPRTTGTHPGSRHHASMGIADLFVL